MDDLIQALQILNRYSKGLAIPTHCEDKILYVNVDPNIVPHDDLHKLKQLSFVADQQEPHFYSHRYGGL